MKLASCVLAAALAGTVSAQTEPTTTAYRLVGIDKAWARGLTGQNTRIAVIDNGFSLRNNELWQRGIWAANFYNYGPVTWGGHGTAMASIAAGSAGNGGMVGVAPKADMILAQIGLGFNSPILSITGFDQALLWSSQLRADVINLSLGYNYTAEFTRSVQRDIMSGAYMVNPAQVPAIRSTDPLAQASKTSIIVVSAGNQGLPYATFPAQFASRLDINGNMVLGGRMLVVGSVTDGGQITSWSNRAGHICYINAGGRCLDPIRTTDFFVVAPGVNILAADAEGTTKFVSGTSPSAALVSGGMALMRQAWPQLRPEQLVQLVLTTARDLGAPGTDTVYGRGMVDFDRATQPQGTVRVATTAMKLGSAATSGFVSAGAAAADSRILARMGFNTLLTDSKILQRVQVVDDYDRNYSANFAQAIGAVPVLYNADAAWLASSYRTRLPMTSNFDLVVDQAHNGIATQLDYRHQAWTYQFQVGSLSEHTGYLGNSGSGALSLGSSATVWTTIGLERSLSNRLSMVAQFGQGHTAVTNSAVSMIQTDPVLVSQTWRLGMRYNGAIRDRDQLQISVADPVHIRSGQARITAVTDYSYETDPEGNTVAHPIVSTETINLARRQSQRVLAVNYQQELSAKSRFQLSSSLAPGGYRFGINYNYVFK
jgi:hypothetical protein